MQSRVVVLESVSEPLAGPRSERTLLDTWPGDLAPSLARTRAARKAPALVVQISCSSARACAYDRG